MDWIVHLHIPMGWVKHPLEAGLMLAVYGAWLFGAVALVAGLIRRKIRDSRLSEHQRVVLGKSLHKD